VWLTDLVSHPNAKLLSDFFDNSGWQLQSPKKEPGAFRKEIVTCCHGFRLLPGLVPSPALYDSHDYGDFSFLSKREDRVLVVFPGNEPTSRVRLYTLPWLSPAMTMTK